MTSEACVSCGAPIRWVRTQAGGRWMPLDRQPVPGGNVLPVYEDDVTIVRVLSPGEKRPGWPLFQSHFASCPNAGEHRHSSRGGVQ